MGCYLLLYQKGDTEPQSSLFLSLSLNTLVGTHTHPKPCRYPSDGAMTLGAHTHLITRTIRKYSNERD